MKNDWNKKTKTVPSPARYVLYYLGTRWSFFHVPFLTTEQYVTFVYRRHVLFITKRDFLKKNFLCDHPLFLMCVCSSKYISVSIFYDLQMFENATNGPKWIRSEKKHIIYCSLKQLDRTLFRIIRSLKVLNIFCWTVGKSRW